MARDTARIVRFAGLLSAALSTGVFFGTRTSLGPSAKDFTPETYVEVQQATVRNLRPVMAPLLPASVAANLALGALSARERRSPAFALTLSGVLSQLAAVVLTGRVELPTNGRVLTRSPAHPPAGWEAVRDRWHTVHTVRTAISVVGLGCLVAAAPTPFATSAVLARAGQAGERAGSSASPRLAPRFVDVGTVRETRPPGSEPTQATAAPDAVVPSPTPPRAAPPAAPPPPRSPPGRSTGPRSG